MKLLQGFKSFFKSPDSSATLTTSKLSPTSLSGGNTATATEAGFKSDVRERLKAADALDKRRREERAEVKRLMSAEEQSDVFVFFETEWLNAWNEFLKGAAPPGPITFDSLLTPYGDVRPSLRLERDYRIIPFEIWDYLQLHHGSAPPLASSYESIESAMVLYEENIPPADAVETEENARKCFWEDDSGVSEASTMRLWGGEERVRGLVGIVNPGFFCYMNASLQCLMSVPTFRDYFIEKNYQVLSHRPRPFSEAFSDLASTLFSNTHSPVRPSKLWALIQSRFSAWNMHDAEEFLHYLLDSLDSELTTKGKATLVATTFMGTLRSHVTCLSCGRASSVDEGFLELSVPLSKSLKNSFRMFTAKENLASGYDCTHCGVMTSASKGITIVTAPRYLLLSIKRFKQHPTPQKCSLFTKFRKRVAICWYSLLSEEGLVEFKLCSVVEHRGEDIDCGHYVAYCRRGKGWYLFDDWKCVRVSLREVFAAQAFVLLYRRIDYLD